MSNPKGTVSTTARSGHKRIGKPAPPEDIWERIDAAVRSHLLPAPPPNSFTPLEYASQRSCSLTTARTELRKLHAKGVVQRAMFSNAAYYWFPDTKIPTTQKGVTKNGRRSR